MAPLGDPAALRTPGYVAQQLLGASWLGSATQAEYAAATWMERNNVSYIFQAVVGAYPRIIQIDFMLLNVGAQRALEIDGDRFHGGKQQRAHDLQRQAVIQRAGFQVVRVPSSAIIQFNGLDAPSEELFDRVMSAAVWEGIELAEVSANRVLGI